MGFKKGEGVRDRCREGDLGHRNVAEGRKEMGMENSLLYEQGRALSTITYAVTVNGLFEC